MSEAAPDTTQQANVEAVQPADVQPATPAVDESAPAPAATPAVDLSPVLAALDALTQKIGALLTAQPAPAPAPAPASSGEAAPAAPVTAPEPAPEQPPAVGLQISVPEGWQPYVVLAEDVLDTAKPALQTIADKIGLGNAFHDLFQPNMDTIENAARAAGHPGSNNGEILIPGTVLLHR